MSILLVSYPGTWPQVSFRGTAGQRRGYRFSIFVWSRDIDWNTSSEFWQSASWYRTSCIRHRCSGPVSSGGHNHLWDYIRESWAGPLLTSEREPKKCFTGSTTIPIVLAETTAATVGETNAEKSREVSTMKNIRRVFEGRAAFPTALSLNHSNLTRNRDSPGTSNNLL